MEWEVDGRADTMRETVEELQARVDEVATLEHNLQSAKRDQVRTPALPRLLRSTCTRGPLAWPSGVAECGEHRATCDGQRTK